MTPSLATTLRQNPTPAEKRLWRLLYPLRASGFHFRKQAPIGPYVADFACHAARLIIEVDGDSHGTVDGEAHDRRRNGFLQSQGYAILRFSNREVLANGAGVLAVIARALAGATPLPASPTRGEVKRGGALGDTLPLVGRDGEGGPSAEVVVGAPPHPTSPTRGEVKRGDAAGDTLPLVGRDGEGVPRAMTGRS